MLLLFIFLGLVLLIIAAIRGFVVRDLRRLEREFDMALSTISGLTAVASKHTERLDSFEAQIKSADEAIAKNENEFAEFKNRFDDVMATAEEQLKEEERWNTGLNNILNFCLDDAYRVNGGDK